MTKTKRKANKERKQRRRLNNIVKESMQFQGVALTVADMSRLQREEGHEMCGYLRTVHYDGQSYQGYCPISNKSCNHEHVNYANDCDVYKKRFGR